MFAPQFVAAGPVGKTDNGLLLAVQVKSTSWQDLAAISGGMLLLRRYWIRDGTVRARLQNQDLTPRDPSFSPAPGNPEGEAF